MSVIEKSTHGFDGRIRATGTPTTSGLTVGDNEASNPRYRDSEPTVSELQALAHKPQTPTAEMSGSMVCGSQVNVGIIKPVDRLTVEGSTPGDHRAMPGDVAKPAVDKTADNSGPRQPMGQAPLSGKQVAASKPQSFIGSEGSDEN